MTQIHHNIGAWQRGSVQNCVTSFMNDPLPGEFLDESVLALFSSPPSPGRPFLFAGLLAWDKLPPRPLVLTLLLLKFFLVSVSTGVPPPLLRLPRPLGVRPSSSEVGESEYLKNEKKNFKRLFQGLL